MNKINLIFLGDFPYPHGMAGTKRIQHAIDGLKQFDDVSIRVIVLRQSSAANPPSGVYRDISYETVMPNLMRMKLVLLSPAFFAKAKAAIRRAFVPEERNILFVYGPPAFDNIPVVRFARKLGYKIVFDIVEDDDAAIEISKSVYHRVKNHCTRRMTRQIAALADGLVVISSHLERKFTGLIAGKIPIHLRPISVDFSCFTAAPQPVGEIVTLFYAGSFGIKNGLPVLLDAFDQLAAHRANVRLVLTGKGSDEMMRSTLARIDASPFKERIEYKGYLDDAAYYAALNDADIPCMTRVDLAYAQAGFPFKLGEFLATGRPVIASRVSDVEHFLEDKRNVLLVKPGSVEEIVKAVDYIHQNPEIAQNIGKQGRVHARECFDAFSQARAMRLFLLSI